jgi:POT family proton-dependent oligopeptide transporter
MSEAVTAPATARDHGFLGHPRGLAFLVFTEAWERFSFYGMQALLVLYMVGRLLHPGAIEHVAGFTTFRSGMQAVFGPLSTQALATQIFGLYGGLTYLSPVFGGLVGDLVLGRRRAVILGALFMTAGHFMMAFEQTFLLALAALITGCGLLKGNIAAQVGGLYARDDRRRDGAFSIYYIGVNVGAFVSPLVCGTLGEVWGWHYGFGAAGVGMLIGLATYLAGGPYLPPDAPRERGARKARLAAGDVRALMGLAVLLFVAILFWTAQSQVWDTYPLWVRDRVDRGLLGLTVPVTWFQSIDSLAVLVLAPLVLQLWRRQARRGAEPDDLIKIAIGCAIFALACAWLALGDTLAGHHKASVVWPIAFHLTSACGYLYFAPIALALFTRAGPEAVNAMMVAVYYVSLFIGSVLSGWLGRFYAVIPNAEFWLLHGAIVASGAGVVLVARRPLASALRIQGGGARSPAGRRIGDPDAPQAAPLAPPSGLPG